jgi:flagellar hook protein FlgE
MALNALFTGSTGLRANSSVLDIIGNNLANLNTSGYKTQRPLFKDLVYQTLSSGTSEGRNPSQLGYGVGVGSVDSIFLQGAVTPTSRSLDAAIQGRGFFTLTDGEKTVYSRSGSFNIDSAGFLVDPNTGFRVQRRGSVGETTLTTPGFQTPGDLDIKVPFGAGIMGLPTQNVNFRGNISNTLAVGESYSTAIQVFDSQSTSRALTVTFTKTAINEYSASATVSGGTATAAATPITFDLNGFLAGPATLNVDLTGIPGADNQTITLQLGTPGQSTGLTQFGSSSTATAVTQDGSGSGTLTAVSFDANGTLQGIFSNGRSVPIAQLAIADFTNDAGLLRDGNNYFISSVASGEALLGEANTGGRGVVQGSSLEGSNVDIALEFSRLIIAQRGFQVNTRTISAANETLQELASIIR